MRAKMKKIFIIQLAIIIFLFLQPYKVFSEDDSKKNQQGIIARLIFFPGWELPIEFINIKESKNGQISLSYFNEASKSINNIAFTKERSEKIINAFKTTGIANDRLLPRRTYCGVDAPCWYMTILSDGRFYSLESWHPFYENKNDVLVTQDGAKLLCEESKNKASLFEKSASNEYKEFLKVWESCFNIFDSLYMEVTGKKIDRSPKNTQ
jgi:hypothetical protein